MSAIDSLFKPFSLKSMDIDNRVVMAPMTRSHSPGLSEADGRDETSHKRPPVTPSPALWDRGTGCD